MVFEVSIGRNESEPAAKARQLLKQATVSKQSGHYDDAVTALRQAYLNIQDTHIDFTVETFLRLPLYLQAGGRPDEAWREFNNLLTAGYPNMPRDEWAWYLMESHVYDKMRLSLQRQKKPIPAVVFGAKAFAKDLRSEMTKPTFIRDESFIQRALEPETLCGVLDPLLKKANRTDLTNGAVDLLLEWVRQIPEQDDLTHEKKLEKLLTS